MARHWPWRHSGGKEQKTVREKRVQQPAGRHGRAGSSARCGNSRHRLGQKGKYRPLLPPQMIPYSHMTGRAGPTQQLVTSRQAHLGRGRPQAPTPLVFIVSRECLEFNPSTYLHREPLQSTTQGGAGRVIKAQNQTYLRRPRPDQARPVHKSCSWVRTHLPGSHIPGRAQVLFSQKGPFSLNFTSQD